MEILFLVFINVFINNIVLKRVVSDELKSERDRSYYKDYLLVSLILLISIIGLSFLTGLNIWIRILIGIGFMALVLKGLKKEYAVFEYILFSGYFVWSLESYPLVVVIFKLLIALMLYLSFGRAFKGITFRVAREKKGAIFSNGLNEFIYLGAGVLVFWVFSSLKI